MVLRVLTLFGAVVAFAATVSSSAVAQQPQQGAAPQEQGTDNPFFQSRIPPEFEAVFHCFQGGAKTVDLANVASFAPRKIDGVMTFSVITADGTNHLFYLGGGTSCGLSVKPPSQ